MKIVLEMRRSPKAEAEGKGEGGRRGGGGKEKR